MSDIDLTRLREIAEDAEDLSGPGAHWVASRDWASVLDADGLQVAVCAVEHEATHIAAFDPPTVLALLDRLEAAEAAIGRLGGDGS